MVSITAGGPKCPRGHMYTNSLFNFGYFVTFESIKHIVLRIYGNYNFVGLLHHPFGFTLFWLFLGIMYKHCKLLRTFEFRTPLGTSLLLC